jgi:D-alanine-D-alanine ligase-like ATP-grasp enzyme
MNISKAWHILTHWEKWHYHAKYIPLYPAWLWYCIRSRSLWFFTPSNPTIPFGGFEGEGKWGIYEQLPPGTYPKSLFISSEHNYTQILNEVEKAGLTFPLAVKPDAGMMGYLFRKIDSATELEIYHKTMPVDYIIQELIGYPLEVSVFYYRYPGEEKGTITGFLKKELVEVTGNGSSTLEALIEAETHRPGFKVEEWKTKHKMHLHTIIPAGERYRISWVANLSRGGRLVSLENEKDNQLLQLFDKISIYTQHFYYGRYDIKCNSIAELKEGKNFSILEYNGSGAEPHHIYGNKNNIFQAYRIVLQHWKVLFEISRANRERGIKPWPFFKGLHYLHKAKAHFTLLKKLDKRILV